MTKLFFAALSIFLILSIARESIEWALLIGCFLFCVLCWLNHEPDSYRRKRERDQRIANESRNQNELINKK